MASAPVGEIPVLITGDWSELQTAIDQAASAAEAGSQKISAAFSSTAGDQIAQEFNQVTQAVTGFDAAVSSSTESFGTLGDYLNSLDAEGGAAADSLKDVEAATAGVGTTTATASGAVSELPPRLHEVAEESGNASEELLGMAKSLAQIAEGLVIIEGLRELAQEALEVYGSVQKAEISLTALTGSAEVATEMIEGLKNVALSNALSFEQLVSASQRMTALGFSTEETRKTLQSAADVAAATGTSLDRVTNAIDRMALSGAAGGRQLAALGISTDTLAKSMGVAAGDVTTAFKALDQSERIAILNDALTKFSGVAGQVAQGVLGQWQNLKTQWEFVMEGIGAALAPIATQLITFAADAAKIIKELVDAFNTLPGPVKDVVVVVGLLAAAGPPVLLALSGIAKSAGLLFEVMAPLKLAFTDAAAYIGGMEGPLTLGTTRLLALGEAAGLAAAAFVGFELGAWAYKQIPGMKALGDSIASFILMVPGVQEAIDHFNGVSAAETSLLDATTKLNDKLALTGNEIIRDVNESLLSFSDRVLAAKKSVEDLTGVHGGLTTAQRELAKAIADVQKTWSDQTLAVINAKANLEAVTIAYSAGTATLGQYQAALDALERAQVAVNPNFVTSKERTKELDDATKALNSSQAAMVDLLRSESVPALVGLVLAQTNLTNAQANYDASLATLEQANIRLNDAVALGTKGYALQGPAIDAVKTAEASAASVKKDLAEAQHAVNEEIKENIRVANLYDTSQKELDAQILKMGDTFRKSWNDIYAGAIKQIAITATYQEELASVTSEQVGMGVAATSTAGQILNMIAGMNALGIQTQQQAQSKIGSLESELALMQQFNQPLSQQLQVEEKIAQAHIDLNNTIGASASATLEWGIALQQAKDKIDAIKESSMLLVNIFQNIRSAVLDAFQSITSTLVKDLFEGVNNDALKQQIQGVQQSMADATASWQQAQQDIAAQMKQAVIDNKQALDQELANLQSQLDDKTKAYADYVANYQSQLADLQKAEQDKTAEQVQALKDNLTQEEQSYDQFKSDTIQKMEDLTQASKDNLEQQLSNLQDQLANQTTTYDRYVEDVNTKLSRIGEDLQQQIGDRSTQEQRSVADKNTQIQRDTQDANERIKRLREQETAANKDSTEQQISDIQLSLSRKQQDAQTYVQRQIQDLQTFTDEHNKQAQEQTDDLKKQLQQRTDDYNAYVADNQKQQDDATSAAKKALADQEMALVASLLKRQVQLTIDKISTQAKIEAVTKANEDELLKREAELKASLDKQTTAYEDAKTKIEQQMVDATAKAKTELATQETNLQTSLDKQATAYKTTMDGYSGQLDTLQAKFKTVWDGIADGLTSVGERMLTNIMVAFFNPMIKNIADFIAGSIADLLGKIGFGGVQDAVGIAIPDAVQGLNDAFNRLGQAGIDAASKIDTAMSGVAPTATSGASGAAGSVGAATSSIMSSISSIVNMVTGAISAITGIIGIFQNMHQESTLNAIEKETARMAIYLGDQSGNSVQYYTGKSAERLEYIMTKLDLIRGDISNVADALKATGTIGTELSAINSNTYWAMKKLDDIDSKTGKNTSGTINVGGTDMGAVITGLQNINNTLQFEVGLSPWFQTAFQNINNGIVACAGWLQGIVGILQAGISTTGSNNTTTGLGALASYVGQNFTALENWLFNALGKTMALPALPGAIALPAALGGPTTNPGTTIVINNTVNGSVVGQNGMNQFANGIGDMLVNKLRSSGMKY